MKAAATCSRTHAADGSFGGACLGSFCWAKTSKSVEINTTIPSCTYSYSKLQFDCLSHCRAFLFLCQVTLSTARFPKKTRVQSLYRLTLEKDISRSSGRKCHELHQVPKSIVTFSTAISACGANWQLALHLLSGSSKARRDAHSVPTIWLPHFALQIDEAMNMYAEMWKNC